MKKLLLILLLLFPLTAYSANVIMMGGAGTTTEGPSSENVGFESAGSAGHTFANDYMYCTRLTDTPSSNGTVESITVTSGCAGDATGAIYLSLYTNGSGKPDDLVANSNVGPLNTVYNADTPYDITHTYTGTKPTVTSGATYWICINNDGTTAANSRGLFTDGSGTCSGTGQCSVTEANAHNNFPANWDSITPDFSDDGRMRGKAFITISY